jgi:hypothetical protein
LTAPVQGPRDAEQAAPAAETAETGTAKPKAKAKAKAKKPAGFCRNVTLPPAF